MPEPQQTTPPTSGSPPPEPLWRRALDNRALMLFMLFCVWGALGIPILWMSRGFSTLSKIVLSIVLVAYTGAMIWILCWFAWSFLIKPIVDIWYA
jgi:hypothetical protein